MFRAMASTTAVQQPTCSDFHISHTPSTRPRPLAISMIYIGSAVHLMRVTVLTGVGGGGFADADSLFNDLEIRPLKSIVSSTRKVDSSRQDQLYEPSSGPFKLTNLQIFHTTNPDSTPRIQALFHPILSSHLRSKTNCLVPFHSNQLFVRADLL